jgi:chemotaxis signal transduction protein
VLDSRCIVPVIRGPKHQLGVLIYDGALIAVLDLRHFFGMRARESKTSSSVIIVQVPSDTGAEIVGLAVDRGLAVTEVESLAGLDGNPRALVSRLDLEAPQTMRPHI